MSDPTLRIVLIAAALPLIGMLIRAIARPIERWLKRRPIDPRWYHD
jgi:hypothetical protein